MTGNKVMAHSLVGTKHQQCFTLSPTCPYLDSNHYVFCNAFNVTFYNVAPFLAISYK